MNTERERNNHKLSVKTGIINITISLKIPIIINSLYTIDNTYNFRFFKIIKDGYPKTYN